METAIELNTDAWVDLYGDALFRFAFARVGDRQTAEDLVQETFLAAVRSLDRFKGQSSEKTWLFAIMKHKIVDHFRKNKLKASGQEISYDVDSMESFFNSKGAWHVRPEHWSVNPGRVHESKEVVDHFYRCLADLPHNIKVFNLCLINKMGLEEWAKTKASEVRKIYFTKPWTLA
jgi:RNA polymerase sigma factor (sigma-70 family)